MARLSREYQRRYYEENRDAVLQHHRDYYARNKERLLANFKARNRALKAEVISHYSNGTSACGCCGETILDFLQLDHVMGEGNRQRKELRGKGNFYALLKKAGFPDEPPLQVLCANCNHGRFINGGVCPHQTTVILTSEVL